MITVKTFVFNPFSENTYILYDETKECVIIDPGCFDSNEQAEITSFINDNQLFPKYILITHGHIDHVLGVNYLKNKFDIPVWVPKEEEATYNAVPSYAGSYGFENYSHTPANYLISEGEEILFGSSSLKTILAPGHSAGHVAFVNIQENICIGGDILFSGSIGRVDLPGGDYDTLITSIKEKLFVLNDAMVVYPGHGATTTIKIEKESNPYFA
ncbi:MAG: MBL fold metallo-hydrolase [Cyclobacteriaceae bacterium]|nr:MBL fold metallo-hydrolase [Cyclobacteriaceae bacterium]